MQGIKFNDLDYIKTTYPSYRHFVGLVVVFSLLLSF